MVGNAVKPFVGQLQGILCFLLVLVVLFGVQIAGAPIAVFAILPNVAILKTGDVLGKTIVKIAVEVFLVLRTAVGGQIGDVVTAGIGGNFGRIARMIVIAVPVGTHLILLVLDGHRAVGASFDVEGAEVAPTAMAGLGQFPIGR